MVSLSAQRDYGYSLGDFVEHAVSLEGASQTELNTSALPQPGPVNDWLILRGADLKHQPINGEDRPIIHLTYQVFKGVQRSENVVIPPLALHMTGTAGEAVEVPAWSFTLNPVIPTELQNEEVEIRPALMPEALDTTPVWHRIRAWTVLMALGATLWGTRIYLLSTRFRPFEEACRLMAAHRRPLDSDPLKHSCRVLHQAMNQTWGGTLFLEDVERFCSLHPEFSPLHDRIIAFFGYSQALFFGVESPISTEPLSLSWLTDLGRRCAAAERSNP